MTNFYKTFQFFLVSSLALNTSCVLQTKYNALNHSKTALETEMLACSDALLLSDDKNKKLDDLRQSLEKDTASLGLKLRGVNLDYEGLLKEHESLNKGYASSVKNTGKLNYSLQNQQREIQNTKAELELSVAHNLELSKNLKKRENKVLELEALIENQKDKAKLIKERVDEALVDFELNDINVKVRNGQVYVSLSDKLLFGSGSVEVNALGKDALTKLAKVLSSQDDFDVIVEGHTDNVPISKFSKYMNDNWDLSVSRATSIVRALIKNGVAPEIIHASGRGQYSPVVNNDSKQSRQGNRRIEVILQARMLEFYNVLHSDDL